MANLEGNLEIARYFTTKHSWRGKYKRIFSIGRRAVTTLNPQSLEVTNQWEYKDFLDISPNPKVDNEFIVTLKKTAKKSETMRFSCDYRDDLLTEALRFKPLYGTLDGKQRRDDDRFNGAKIHWSERKMPVLLIVTACSLNQHDAITKKFVCSYDYKNIEAISLVSDYPGAFVLLHGGFGRMHMFVLEDRDGLLKKVQESSNAYIGFHLKIRREPISSNYFQENRLGKYSADEHVMSLAEFPVQKHTRRHPEPVPRILALSETCLIERDPGTYSVVTIRPLSDVFSLIRSPADPQHFAIEYVRGEVRMYTSTDRDSLLASVLDGVRASGNRDVCVKMSPTQRGNRHGPLYIPVEEEVESQLLRAIGSSLPGEPFALAVNMFNANISYSGLLHAVTQDGFFVENKEKLINGALSALLAKEGDQNTITGAELEGQFHALRRLFASKAGFASFINLPGCREKMGYKVVKALKRKNDAITFAAIDMLNCLMQPMHDNYDLGQEQMNKASLLASKGFLQELLKVFVAHVCLGTGALVISALLDFLTFALCAPYSETTEGAHFDMLLEMVADLGRYMYRLFQHPSMAIVKGAGLLMKAIIEEGEPETAARMQDLALAEGALPRHLLTAMFTNSSDSRMLTNRQLSRHLVGLWTAGHPTAQALLRRIIPLGLTLFLQSTEAVPAEKDRMHVRDNLKAVKTLMKQRTVGQVEGMLLHWKTRLHSKKAAEQRPVTLRRRRQRVKAEDNWAMFYYQFEEDHNKASLIWNFKTREELRDALETEIRNFMVDRDLIGQQAISWNHVEFEVRYESLQDEIKIGDYYLRLLLEEGTETADLQNPLEFFNDLYHRFLLSPKSYMKAMCLQAMTIVYSKSHEQIGPFNDAKFMVALLDRSTDRVERDRVLLFIDKLLLNKRNVKQMLDTNLLRQLVELMSLAHLHITRATVPLQTNVIEAAPDMHRDTVKEWYYGNKEKERLGPFSFREMREFWSEGSISQRTRCWAQGMEGWRTLDQVLQLKWTLMATGQPLLNESDLATLILDMLIRICSYYPSRDQDGAIIRPLPRAKRLLSEANVLPHLCQLLLTFDPKLVEKVSLLLNEIMEDNPSMPRLYMTGVFFFILMYTGSNVLPIGHFLKDTHLKQAFKPDEQMAQISDMMQRSILGQILPEAMVHFLENHGTERFAEVFLGDFDTPEAIWNNEMRRLMIEKIAAHLGDFTPRLTSNVRALYNYCPMPMIAYPQLEDELFCNIFYLRHLCDVQRFPDWPISDHIKLLKDILEAWKAEVDKKPSSMSVDEAYETLALPTGKAHEESAVRKAYFKMAQKYHPDKNPDGRDIFEAVNKAYEFLCSKRGTVDGPDPAKIVLLLQAQSIIFKRFKEELKPFKYAGYPMLVKTIQLETKDEQLFSKSAPLLTAATELCYHTVSCSALNAEELRREFGMEALQEALARCVAVLSHSAVQDDRAVEICTHIARCFRVSAQFDNCREKFTEIPAMVSDLCRILYYRNLPKLNAVVVQTCSAFTVDFWLQTQLFQAGILWHLLLFLFKYDYTLDESGVEASADTNKQEVSNELARLSIVCLGRLGGYLSGENATPENPTIKKALNAMLTPYLSLQISMMSSREVLKLLNSNTENPYLIWDNATRAELTEFLETQQQSKVRTGECDPEMGGGFQFEAHKDELSIGDIYVRVYNEQPTFPLKDPKKFTVDLLCYLGSQAEYLHSLMALTASDVDTSHTGQQATRLKHCTMALESLRNVLRNQSGSEEQVIGHFRLIFALLRMSGAAAMQQLALEVINATTGNRKCVANIAEAGVFAYLLMVVHTLPSCRLLALETMHALMANTTIVKEAMQKGALVYLLDLFCNSQNPSVREQAAALFAKMMSDKLIGPKVRIALSKFLPQIFLDAMTDNPEAAVVMFEGTHENPELVWNDEAREKVSNVVKRLKADFYNKQKDDPTATWSLPIDFAVVYTEIEGELIVGGVILKLFIAQPTWVLRRPKEFFLALMERLLLLISKSAPDGQELEMVSQAVVALFTAQSQLMDQVPVQGHIPRLFNSMESKNNAIPKACVLVVRQLCENESCIRAMGNTNAIAPMVSAMKQRPDSIGHAAEGLARMYEFQIPSLVEQALRAELVQFLLNVLDSPLTDVDNPAATKAQVVRALKAMVKDLAKGDEVNAILEKSSIWSTYRDQRHDLFITSTNIAGYLQGPVGVAGYLTAGPSASTTTAMASSSEPPPMDQPQREERDLLGLG